MKAENYFATNNDLRFYFEDVIDWKRVVPLFAEGDAPVEQTASSWRDVLGVAGDYIGKDISARATRQADGTWRINGRKQFISSGNGGVGVLLARAVPGSTGLDGLALFIVPRCVPDAEHGERENLTVERAEDKVCITGSPTCALSFEDSYA